MSGNKEKVQWDSTYEPLFKLLLHKKGIQSKEAIEVGKKVVNIIRGKDFREFLIKETNTALLKKRFPNIFDSDITDECVNSVGSSLLKLGFITRVVDQAFKTKAEEVEPKKKSWPSRVGLADIQQFDSKGFYMIKYQEDGSLRHFLLGLVIVLTICMFMFPAWPLMLKIAAVHVLVALSTSLLALSVVRLILFVIVWCFGADFWLFPNLNDEYLGIIDSFKPVYSFEWRKDELLMKICRFTSLVIIALACYQLSLTHTLADVGDFVSTAYLDVVEWSVDKLTKAPEPNKSLPSWEQIQKDTADVDVEL